MFLVLELLVFIKVSDLPSALGGWQQKTAELANLQVPTDNFYGPGAALLNLPFYLLSIDLTAAAISYYVLGIIGFWKICELISSRRTRIIVLMSLPSNLYFIWLINSSQDTVFEFFLLTWSCYFLIKKQYLWFSTFAFILSLTRAGYWTYFILSSILILFLEYIRKKKINFRATVFAPMLIIVSFFNLHFYNSVSPALEGGMTAYFSYSKYHYLALPKMDMDVFLSGPKGAFSEEFGPKIPKNSDLADENRIYQKAAIQSALENKKETVLGWMQKFDSYYFDVQKIPHLPGRYVLNQSEKIISIENERLTWSLVLGNLFYLFWRTLFVSFGLISIGIFLSTRFLFRKSTSISLNLWPLALPYLFGVIPGMLFYTETRFKIVSELILVPLIAQVWVNAFKLGSNEKIIFER